MLKTLPFACRELVPNLLRLLNELINLRVSRLLRPGQDKLPLSAPLLFELEALLQFLLLKPGFLLRLKPGLLTRQDSALQLCALMLQNLLSLLNRAV